MTMLSPTLRRLFLSVIPSLVELPSSIRNCHNLDCLHITECINMKTLPTGINLQHLYSLSLTGCTSLRTFPDISTSIEQLYLDRTGIVEVPWWINKFSKLEELSMESCSNLERVSLNLHKLKKLEGVDFSNCGKLTEASWTDRPDNLFPEVSTNFICNNLDPEALLHQPSFIFKKLMMSGEEVPSYFTHLTTGTSSSLTIPLPPSSISQPFFRFRACALGFFDSVHPRRYKAVFIRVSCLFRGIFGDSFDSFGHQQIFSTANNSALFMFNCRIPLHTGSAPISQLNYDHVDVQLHVSNRMDATFRSKILDPQELHRLSNISGSKYTLKGWGIRLVEDYLSPKDELGNPNSLAQVCEDNIYS